jgi:hypothetical protein
MRWAPVLLWTLAARAAFGQAPCANTPAYTPCDLVFELSPAEAAEHPNPYLTVDLRAELRSPRHRTFLLPAFWDGGRRLVIRFTPTEAGEWVYRLSGNLKKYDGQQASFTAVASEAPGFVRPANVHHWAYTEGIRPHFWMGVNEPRFAFLPDAEFRALADARAAQKFTHLRGLVLGGPSDKVFPTPDTPDPAYFQRLDQRIRYLNDKGLVVDLMLASAGGHLAKLFPTWEQRQRFLRYLIGRYAPMNITWLGVEDFETYPDGRALLKEIGGVLKESDPYQHARSTGARVTSAALLDDEWMDFVTHGAGADAQVGSIEHQLYKVPFVNLEATRGQGDELRRSLWNAAMNGQYVSCTLPAGGPAATQATAFSEFFAGTRYWELEPYFDVDGGRALALEENDHIVYIEKPSQPIELMVERHGYDVNWINPLDGAVTKAKDYKGEHFTGETPNRAHDWVLRVARLGRLEGMGRSYKFESRSIGLQEIELNSAKVPFEIEAPAADLSLAKPMPYAAKIKRATRATRSMMYLWTGESAADGQGYRVLATGAKGTARIDPGIAKTFPAVLHLRLLGMNANGKVYSIDRTYQLNP